MCIRDRLYIYKFLALICILYYIQSCIAEKRKIGYVNIIGYNIRTLLNCSWNVSCICICGFAGARKSEGHCALVATKLGKTAFLCFYVNYRLKLGADAEKIVLEKPIMGSK